MGVFYKQLIKGLLFFTLLLSSSITYSQGESWVWYFGANAGVNFPGGGAPVSINGGQVNTIEGEATISDAAGNLLFYTDGMTVWAKTHTVMTNGNGLMGNSSSSQSGVIVPRPGNPNIYYVFTVDAQAGANGLRYSEVDLSLNSGFGAVTAVKNFSLWGSTTEKCTAVKHCNNKDIWVITHDWNTNQFRTFLVTNTGVNTTPVISAVGTIHTGSSANTIGYLKASPDGKKLAYATYWGGFLEICDFDNSTGIVSNPLNITDPAFTGCYGVEFSPNNNLVYFGNFDTQSIYQFDLCAGSPKAIIMSSVQIATDPNNVGALQLGPDKKIYVARYPVGFLGVINNPNTLGAGCGYVSNGVSIAPNLSQAGLPNFIQSYLKQPPPPFTYTLACLTASFTPPIVNVTSCSSSSNAIQSYAWNFGDPGSGANNVSSLSNPIHTFTGPGTYTVQLILGYACGADTLKQPVVVVTPSLAINNSSATCTSLGSATVTASGGTGPYTYTWMPSAQNGSVATGLNAGVYTITVKDNSGCIVTGTTNIAGQIAPSITVTPLTSSVCLGGNVNLSASGATSYSWTPATGLSSTTGANVTASPPATTVYTVIGTTGACTAQTTTTVNLYPQPSAILNSSNATCGLNNGQIIINNTSGFGQTVTSFSFNGTNIGTQTINAVGAGTHTVSLTNNFGCTANFTVNISNTPSITALGTTTVSATCGLANGSIILGVVTGGTPTFSYSVNGGAYSTSPPLTNLSAGTYTIGVLDAAGCSFTKTVVIGNLPGPSAVSFTTTQTACLGSTGTFSVTGVTGGSPAYSFSVNGVSTGSLTTNLGAGSHTVAVKDANNCTYTTNFNISMVQGPTNATVVTANAACGNANGSATVTGVSGGLPAYQYALNGGSFSTNTVYIGLSAGVKTLVVQDANNCTFTMNFNIGNTGSPVSSINATTNVSCFGGSNGGFSVTTTGGTPGYSYTLTPGNITSGTGIYSGLPAGNYNINVQDAAGCITNVSVSISQPSALSLTLTPSHVSCNTGTNGGITATGAGGSGPYEYALNGGGFQSSTTFTNLSAGVYNITLKDNNGCLLTQSVSVTQPPAITLVVSTNSAICLASNGSASVTASGGTPIYFYSWTGGGGTLSQTNPLPSGFYTVTVTDNNGCVKTAQAFIPAANGGTAVITSSNNVSCNGYANGMLTAGFIGPMTPPVSYTWSNGSNAQTNTPLGPGPYTCTVTDVNGCSSIITATITEPDVIDFLLTSTSVTCHGGNNGSATFIPMGGGTPPYSYLWTPGGATTTVASNLPAGNYTCTVTDANGCTASKSVTVTQPSSVTLTSSVTTANCNQSNGSASVTASGGVPAYTYSWSTGATGSVLNGAAAGTYTLLVTDANNCTYTTAATVPNASGPSLAITSQTNVSCNGGNNASAVASAGGGVPPYAYLWSNGQITGTATNLQAGVYTATVTDAMGCKASVSVTITQPAVLTVSVTGTNPLCFNGNSGTANAGVLGGTPGYNYTWTPSGGNSASASGLSAGNYIVTVQDLNGCVTTGTIALNNPPQMLASISSTNVSCFGACNALAVATTTNASGAVAYFWVGGGGSLSTQTVTNLCPGSYTMTATDQNNCQATSVVNITQPALLTASITAVGNASCAGYTNGFATVLPGGGTPAYSYSWTPSGGTSATASNLGAGIYTVTITDSKLCAANAIVTITQPPALTANLTATNVTCNGLGNGIGNVAYSGGTGPYSFLWTPTLYNTAYVTNLPPGNHTVQITDNQGCVTTLTTTITQPAPLTAAVTSTNSNCNQANGSACVIVGGGSGSISYLWTSNPTFTNPCIQNVVAGAYTITVTDANGCNASAIAIINDIAGPNVSITATTGVSCFGGSNGSANTSITGGTGTVSVIWSHLAQTTPSVSNLPDGLHSVTVQDQAGCVASATVLITQPPLLNSAIVGVTHISCNGFGNGSATMLLNGGGTPAYNYSWMPSSQSASMAVSLAAGVHTCLVTDNNGCTTSQTVNITQPSPLIINSFSITPVLCNGGANGQIITNIIGGTPVYSYSWTPAQPANPVITNLSAGTYSLLVTDTKSCTTTGSYIIIEPTAIVTAASATAATCGLANGASTVNVNGGTPGYTYFWNTSPPQFTQIATGVVPGTWTCTITDNNGCVSSQTVTVPNAPGPVLGATSFTAPLCHGQLNGVVSVTHSSGTAPFAYLWSNGQTSQTVNGVGAGIYTVMISDAYGCSTSGVVNVTQPNILVLNVSSDSTICYGQTATIYAQGGGGTPAYSYSWTPSTLTGAGPHNVTPTSNTSYIVGMSDANGCGVSAKTILIKVRPQLIAQGYSLTACHGHLVSLSPNITSPGNGGPYSYNWSNGASTGTINVMADYPSNPNTYSLIISDGCTSPNATANFTVHVNPLPIGDFNADKTSGCAPLNVNFLASSNGANDQYVWQLGQGALGGGINTGNPVNYSYPDTGSYSVNVTITNQFGCSTTITKNNYITVYPNPIADFNANPWLTTILEPNVQFTNLSMGANSYFWDFGDYDSGDKNNSTVMHPKHDYSYAGIYKVYLIASNSFGCTDTAVHTLEILPDYAIYIPNAFTPDDNGKNDIFQPKGVGINPDSYRMYIFDRWGEVIFSSNNFFIGWDGKVKGSTQKAQDGVYIYKIYAEDLYGNQHQYVGHLTLLSKVRPE